MGISSQIEALEVLLGVPSGFTVRSLSKSAVHIQSYPFLPPSTVDGFLLRLLWLKHDLQKILDQSVSKDNQDGPLLLHRYEPAFSLGAIPTENYTSHIGTRQGIADLSIGIGKDPTKVEDFYRDLWILSKFTGISGFALSGATMDKAIWGKECGYANKSNYQMMTSETIMTPQLRGFVVCLNQKSQEKIVSLANFGHKIGKDGFAFIESVKSHTLEMEEGLWTPSTLIPPRIIPKASKVRLFPMYYYSQEEKQKKKGKMSSFYKTAIFGQTEEPMQSQYYTNSAHTCNIPIEYVNFLQSHLKLSGGITNN